MQIGIDIDDVLTKTSEILKDFLYRYEKTGDGQKYLVEIMRGDIPTENIKKFYDNYLGKMFTQIALKENAKDVIERLIKKGNDIIFITARGQSMCEGAEEATLKFLKENDIKYKNVIFNSHEKQVDCIKNKIDVMIDDSVKNCELVNSVGIKSIVFTSEVNRQIKTDIKRVENWIELENVLDELSEVQNIKCN